MKPIIKLNRRHALGWGLGAFASMPWTTHAQGVTSTFPRGPLKVIMPFGAGGAADAVMRPVALELEKALKQPVLLEHKPGGLFTIGMQAISSAPADGHTLIFLSNSLASVQATQGKFDLTRDLIPIGQMSSIAMVMLVPGNSPFKSVADLVKFAKANPKKLNYGTLGPGSVEHLKTLQMEKISGISAQQVPYKAGTDAVKALVGGEIDLLFTAASFGMAFAPKGQVKVLGVLGTNRLSIFPDVPTMTEAGLEIPPVSYWSGLGVHPDTPQPIVQRLHAEITAASQKDSVRERLSGMAAEPVVSKSPADFRQVIAEEIAWMANVSKGLNLGSS
jgi:tripartite-type tricarboxylate transporter receptor subunit TctC